MPKSVENAAAGDVSPFRSPEQRVAERAAKREAVLRAAVRTFNARGFQAASLDDVAARLKISKPTIYHYLGNKEQVLLECVTRGLEILRGAATKAQSGQGSGLERLTRFLTAYAEAIMDDFGRCVIRTADEALSPEGGARFRALKSEIDAAMRALIEQGVADGSIGPVDVKMAAFTLAGALNWPARWHDSGGPMPPEAIAKAMVDVLVRGLAPRP
ncbi:TetR/AcrR family transcriptional regulator [Sphingomonas naphthae]|uniref:TetR/AcrR family transcriptional regulator n=1 Tax=Sphingomonas naphthae TaxID=1813468 RepID=A0ABY7TK51_9SPHN|nr:TetR/AcrR family transcriptional regulator [Sphingomonas naphthae]WCT73607.1 TetR/AcrR family transcriptional regulator [Sphingomonas naphthae]